MPAKEVPEIAACHEMGHAVVAMVFGLPVRRASIRPSKRSFGRVVMAAVPGLDVDVELYILLAGPFAPRRFAPRSRWLTGEFNKANRAGSAAIE